MRSKTRARFGILIPLLLLPLLLPLLLSSPLDAAGPAGTADPAGQKPARPPKLLKAKTFNMRVENWAWVPDAIRVAQGTQVTLMIEGFHATHRFDLKEYGLEVKLPQGEVTKVEFLADKVGTFHWKCGRPCGNGCPKMRGTLTVVDPTPEE